MSRPSTLWRRVSRDWPSWAQVLGFGIGLEQLGAWGLGGREPNLGAITFASALLMFQRAASARHTRRVEKVRRRLVKWVRDHDLLVLIYGTPAVAAVLQWVGVFHA